MFGQELRLKHVDDPDGLAIAEFDGDGDLDIAVVGRDHGQLAVFFNKLGTGTFVGTGMKAAIEERPVAIAAGDLDGDGKIDLAVGAGDDVSTLLNGGAGTFPASLSSTIEAAKKTVAVVVGDVNGDGALDIVVVDDKAVLTVLISGQGPIEHHHPW